MLGRPFPLTRTVTGPDGTPGRRSADSEPLGRAQKTQGTRNAASRWRRTFHQYLFLQPEDESSVAIPSLSMLSNALGVTAGGSGSDSDDDVMRGSGAASMVRPTIDLARSEWRYSPACEDCWSRHRQPLQVSQSP